MSNNPLFHNKDEPLLNIPNAGKMAVIALLGAGVTQGMQLLEAVLDLNKELDLLVGAIERIEVCDNKARSP